MDDDRSFGHWLKRRRKGLDLTQAELAQRVGCAVGTIRRLESEDLRPSKQVAERLAAALSIPAERRGDFVAFARRQSRAEAFEMPAAQAVPAEPPEPRAPQADLPAPATPLIGRAHTAAAAGAVLLSPEVRLLALTGPPGIGKTRLALQLAADARPAFADGVWFIGLAPLGSPSMVLPAIAQALGLRDDGRPLPAALADRLRYARLLLVLDNCEHVIGAAPALAELLAAAPRLKLLCTSRVALRLSGEHEFVVPPLALPDLRNLPGSDTLEQYAAVRLFAARARAVQAKFAITADNARTVAEICHRLDGLPLAIELAATRTKLFTPSALLARLDRRLPLLTEGPRDAPARQRTLEAAIAWSYDLLEPHEQALFDWLGIFAGGWTIEAAEGVITFERLDVERYNLLDGLTALVDHSLVQQSTGADDEPRFTMLETIREYALARLAARDALAAARRQHADYYLALATAGERELLGPRQPVWLERLDQDSDNMRAVLDWSLAAGGDPRTALQLGGRLWWFWWASGQASEGRGWLARALERAPAANADRARALLAAGNLAFFAGDFAIAQPLLEEAEALATAQSQAITRAYAVMLIGSIKALSGDIGAGGALIAAGEALLRACGPDAAWFLGTTLIAQLLLGLHNGDTDFAQRYGEEALAIFQTIGQPYGIASALNYLGDIARVRGDYPTAEARYTASLPLMRRSNVKSDLPALLHNLGNVALAKGERERAAELFAEAIELHRHMGDRMGIAECLNGLAAIAAGADPLRAARLYGAAAALRDTLGMPMWAAERIEYERNLAAARSLASDATWESAWAIGQALSLDQALAEASIH
jgi:non-specific serine/threonine protein kinase